METKTELRKETLETLHDLVRINVDSANGFEKAAELVESQVYRRLFNDCAVTRRGHGEELKTLLRMNDDDVNDSGSIKANVHRWWMTLRSTVQEDDVRAMLIEAERGEDAIKALYEDVIKETTGNAVNDVLHRQYREVKATHDRIRDLRDAVK